MKGIGSEEEIEYFEEQELESDEWSDVKGTEVEWKSAKCREGKGIKAGWVMKYI